MKNHLHEEAYQQELEKLRQEEKTALKGIQSNNIFQYVRKVIQIKVKYGRLRDEVSEKLYLIEE